jgi:integrase
LAWRQTRRSGGATGFGGEVRDPRRLLGADLGAAQFDFKLPFGEAAESVGQVSQAMRHSYGTHLIRSGVRKEIVAKILGNRDELTTDRYAWLGTATLKAGVRAKD